MERARCEYLSQRFTMQLVINGRLPEGPALPILRAFRERIAAAGHDTQRWSLRLRNVAGFVVLERIPGADLAISFPDHWFQTEQFGPMLLQELDRFLLDVVGSESGAGHAV
jgi:hypothetical protein